MKRVPGRDERNSRAPEPKPKPEPVEPALPDRRALDRRGLLKLQATVGNKAVSRMLREGGAGVATRSGAGRSSGATGLLSVGDKGPAVRRLQRNLREAGFSPGAIDGQFGSGTRDAVVRFQRAARITADGVAGPVTRRKLRRLVRLKRAIRAFIALIKTLFGAAKDWFLGKLRAAYRAVRRLIPGAGGSGSGGSGHPQGSGAAPGGPTAAPPPGSGRTGIVSNYGDEKAKLRAAPSTSAPIVGELGFNTRLFVGGKAAGSWYFVTTASGKYGYVYDKLVKTNLPEPLAKLHLIKSGESAIGIAEHHYRDVAGPGQDLRFFVNVLEYVNRGQGKRGIYQPNPGDKSRDAWKHVKTRANYLAWVPSDAFAKSLKGVVGSGSLTGGAWARVRGALETAKDIVVGAAAFVAGLLQGAVKSIWDLLVGLPASVVRMVWDIGKSLFSGDILHDAKEFLTALSWRNVKRLARDLFANFLERWNAKSVFSRWKFRGYVVGYAIGEILIAIFTAGIGTAAKVSAKLVKLAEYLDKLGPVRRLKSSVRAKMRETDTSKKIVVLADSIRLKHAKSIANGHAWQKHVIEKGEFPEIHSKDEFADLIFRITKTPSASKPLKNNRSAFWDDATQTVVIKNPNAADWGTCFRPDDGKSYYDRLK